MTTQEPVISEELLRHLAEHFMQYEDVGFDEVKGFLWSNGFGAASGTLVSTVLSQMSRHECKPYRTLAACIGANCAAEISKTKVAVKMLKTALAILGIETETN